MTVKAAPTVWAIMAGRSMARVPERTLWGPSHASQTPKPSAIVVPVIHRSVTSAPVHAHLGWPSRCSISRADSPCWPPNGWCSRRPPQPLDPLRRGGDGVGLEQHERARLEPAREGKRGPQRGPPARHPVKGNGHALADRRLVLDDD